MTNQLQYLAFGVGVLSVLVAASARAEVGTIQGSSETALLSSNTSLATAETEKHEIHHLSNLTQPATTIQEWVAQIEQSLAQVTGVQVIATDTGLEIVLETTEPLETSTSVVGNTLITDIPNAVLALPEGEEFQQFSQPRCRNCPSKRDGFAGW